MVLTTTPQTQLGKSLPDFSIIGTDDKIYTPKNFAADVLVIVFTCNHCPYAQAVWPRLIQLAKNTQNVDFAAINANDAVQHPDDSFENMQAKVQEWGIPFAYLHDETQGVAKTFGAVCTPDIFVFDKNRTLAYRGRFDDNWKDEQAVTRHELADAIEQIKQGKVPANQQPSMGCNIKWR